MSLLSDTRGLATVEAAVVLPVFIVIFCGLVVIHRLYDAKFSAMTEARECAWAYANGGCESAPENCRIEGARGVGLQGILDGNAAAAARFDDEMASVGRRHGSSVGSAAEAIGEVSQFATQIMGIGSGFTATASRDYGMPSVYGGGSRSIAAGYASLCNEKPMDILDLTKRFYCAFAGDEGKC